MFNKASLAPLTHQQQIPAAHYCGQQSQGLGAHSKICVERELSLKLLGIAKLHQLLLSRVHKLCVACLTVRRQPENPPLRSVAVRECSVGEYV